MHELSLRIKCFFAVVVLFWYGFIFSECVTDDLRRRHDGIMLSKPIRMQEDKLSFEIFFVFNFTFEIHIDTLEDV